MIRCLIVDDEPLAQNVIESYIQRVNFLTLAGKCENAIEAYQALEQGPVELIFCDIQMPEITGIEFVKALKSAPFVIFTTAFPEYAIEGFNVDAIDYLLKPIAFERFFKSVMKVKSQIDKGSETSRPETQRSDDKDHLFVKEDYKLVKINHADIFYIQGMKDYVRIYTTSKEIITHITMKRLEDLLPKDHFFRTHKSFIIRLSAIKTIYGNMIEMTNKAQVPIGLQYREQLMTRVNNVN